MKKYTIAFILFIFSFLFITQAGHCEEAIYIGVPFYEKNKRDSLPEAKAEKKETPVEEKQNKHQKRFKKVKKFNYKNNKSEEVPQGYYGVLPDIEGDFKYKNQQTSSLREKKGRDLQEEDIEEQNFKEAAFNDPLFLDILVKKDKTSTYLNDLQKTKLALQNLKNCIEEQGDIQRFNGCINMLDLYVKNLKTKYENKSETLKESYIDILNTNYYSKVLGNLLYDANYYSKYIPTSEGKYSKESIDIKKQDLLNRINKTLFTIANES